MEAIASSYQSRSTEFALVDDLLESHRGYARGPERALLAALLFDGVQAYMNYVFAESSEHRKRYSEAYRWVHHSDKSYVFSFENVCEALGIDCEYLRLGLTNAANSQSYEWKRARRHF